MDIKFASDLIKITFKEPEPFSGRSLVMSGEVIKRGFAAILSTMCWLSPNKGEYVSNEDKTIVCNLVRDYNNTNNFYIDLIQR